LSEEYRQAEKRLCFLHRLTQIHREISKALKDFEHNDLAHMNEEIQTLRIELIHNHNDEIIQRVTIRCEEIHIQFGIVLQSLGFREVSAVDIQVV